MKKPTRFVSCLVSFSMPLLLAACAGQAPRSTESTTTVTESNTTPSTPARKPNITAKRGGGYYKDDGPGDEIPGNLDEIPDAQPRNEPLHRYANRPYVVLGKSYVPNSSVRPLRQRGIASWYGKKFHGQKTSIGETYDMFSMTAAHPTLALPSYVRVTNVSNGKTVVVRVIDRGPFHADRIIDLSYAAAYRLGYVNNGSTQVEIEAILPGDNSTPILAQAKPQAPAVPPAKAPENSIERDEIEALASTLAANEATAVAPAPQTSTQKGVFLQLGAFSSADNAESLRSHLSRDLDWLSEEIQLTSGGGMHRIQLGPYANRSDAEIVAEKIRLALGYKPSLVTR